MNLQSVIHKFFNRFDKRTSKALKNTILSFVIKGASILITLAFVPLLLNELNPERYGIWLTLTSIISILSFSDIGLGHGLKNLLAESFARDDFVSAKKLVSTAYFSMALTTMAIFMLFLIVNYFIKWDIVLNAPSSMRNELSTLILIVFLFFCFQLVLNLVNSILTAYQMPAYSSAVFAIGQFLSFLGVFILSKFYNKSSLIPYGLIISLAPVLALLITSILLFLKKIRTIIPSYKYIDKTYLKRLYSIGVKFFSIQLTAVLLYQSNNLIIAHIAGTSDVAIYNVAYKYASIFQMLFSIILSPIWVASADAYVRCDYLWIKKTIKRLNYILALFILFSIFQLLFSNKIYNIWVGSKLQIDFMLTGFLILYFILSMRSNIYCYVINGTGKIQFQFVITLGEVFLHIPLAIVLGKLWGVTGVVVSMCIIMFINSIWMPIQCNRLLNNSAKGILNR
jgi:O-antigen/teichoic acid export membrane protein